MRWFIDHCLADDEDTKLNYASPLLRDDLSKLPNAYIMTAGLDVLRDDGHEYCRSLNAAGNSVEYREFSSMVRGFLALFVIIPAAEVALDEVVSCLKFSLR
jgi:acetyl esterase